MLLTKEGMTSNVRMKYICCRGWREKDRERNRGRERECVFVEERERESVFVE